ncbi:cation diffusion facilitator family transporter [bacterium]|nr:cation diffusion facilitator family transporter [bacterium]
MLPRSEKSRINQSAAFIGLFVNVCLVIAKLLAGILGHSYALVADAVESSTDVIGSLVVWGGLRISARPPDDAYPYGYGRAESLAVAVLALLLLSAAVGIATASIHEILTPHHTPAAYTLAVLAGVIGIKEGLFRRVQNVALETESLAVLTDAWHHRSDAITSAAAFVGIALAIWGGPGWEASDDWAALLAAGIIGWNGYRFLRVAVEQLMDRQPASEILNAIALATQSVPEVQQYEKLRVRPAGDEWYVDLHIQVAPQTPLFVAHQISGRVKSAIREQVPSVRDVLIHIEPYWEPASAVLDGPPPATH